MNTGGPAFPQHGWSNDPKVLERMKNQGGMTLLDWMAGQALAGLCSSWYDRHKDDPETQRGHGPALISQSAYTHAEAMLAEKARREADHSEDTLGKVAALEAANRELVEELEKFTNTVALFTGDGLEVRSARATIAKAKGTQ